MFAIPLTEATEQLARAVESASPNMLAEVHAELYPEKPVPPPAEAAGMVQLLAERVRTGMEPEDVVDLWNVVFPKGRDAYFDEELGQIRRRPERW